MNKTKKPYKKGDIIYVFSALVHHIIEVEDIEWSRTSLFDKNFKAEYGWVVDPKRGISSLKNRRYLFKLPLGDNHRLATEEECNMLNKLWPQDKRD